MEKIAQEFRLAILVPSQERQFRVTRPFNTEVHSVARDWPEPDTGATLVNRLMELNIGYLERLRRQ